jgi:hypothetical protein
MCPLTNGHSQHERTPSQIRPIQQQKDTGEDLIGQKFTEDNETFIITECSQREGLEYLDYISSRTKEQFFSTVP